MSTTFDLSTLGLADGTYSVAAVAKGTNLKNSAVSTAVGYEVKPGEPNYLTFSSPSTFTLKVGYNKKYWDGTLEYSTDAATWNAWDGTVINSSADGKLYMRGVGNTLITGNNPYQYGSPTATWVFTGSNVSCEGNIETLLDYATVAAGEHPEMADYCYYYLFRGWTSLITVPELPSPTLTRYCYNSMFYNCKSITSAPELPATTLADYCYSLMFYGCTALTSAPELPVATLTAGCYSSMFSGCTALTSAPELQATTLADYCYASMFYGCTTLTTIPKLPATTLATNCYSRMFHTCKSITSAPELPATTLADSCYKSMFYQCTSLTTIPKLPATTLATDCYYGMFSGCTSVKFSTSQSGIYQTAYRIPTSGTGTTASSALMGMFYNTGGSYTGDDIGTPAINTTYYLSTSNTVV